LAEVAVYDAEKKVYGKVRQFTEQLIVVKEDLRADTLVKADQPNKVKTKTVLKLNQIQKYETKNYPYSILTSVFIEAKNPQRLVKITVGSQEWCGNTFKIYKEGKLKWHSYFDGEADGSVSLRLGEDELFEDQLPLSLRDFPFKLDEEKRVRIWESLTNNRAQAPQAEDAIIKVVGEEVIRTYGGSIPSWKLIIKKPSGSDYYWFAKEFPYVLTKMVTHKGHKRVLHGRARWKYWDTRFPKPPVLN